MCVCTHTHAHEYIYICVDELFEKSGLTLPYAYLGKFISIHCYAECIQSEFVYLYVSVSVVALGCYPVWGRGHKNRSIYVVLFSDKMSLP